MKPPAPYSPAPGYERVRTVGSFAELLAPSFGSVKESPDFRVVNALCWPRALAGDFGEIVRQLGPGEGIVALDEARLGALTLSPAGQAAREIMLTDLRLLRDHGLAPELNCLYGYPRDDDALVPTDVYDFHADSAPIESATWLCTYHGAPSEGLRNEDAQRRTDDPATRAALLREYGGSDDAGFAEYLAEHHYDLHYAAAPGAQPFSFGLGHLWRIALDWAGSPVPPCIHRAPATTEPRLLLIS